MRRRYYQITTTIALTLMLAASAAPVASAYRLMRSEKATSAYAPGCAQTCSGGSPFARTSFRLPVETGGLVPHAPRSQSLGLTTQRTTGTAPATVAHLATPARSFDWRAAAHRITPGGSFDWRAAGIGLCVALVLVGIGVAVVRAGTSTKDASERPASVSS